MHPILLSEVASIVFADNAAASGGSIYLTHNSTVTLKGVSLFRNNTSNSSQEVMNYRKILSCNNVNSMREIKLTNSTSNGSGGAIVCNNSYLEIYYYSNFTHNIAEWHGGVMMLHTCVLNIQGNTSFVGNKAFDLGGAMLLRNTKSNINGNLFLNKNQANYGSGGALFIIEGKFIIKGHTLFDSNSAKYGGGALFIGLHANFIFYGSIYSGSSYGSFDPGALPLNSTKAFDAECSTDNALSFNNSITFLNNTCTAAGTGGGSISC